MHSVFTADYERELQRSQSTHTLLASPKSVTDTAPSANGTDKVKMLSRTASAFALPQDSLLWCLRVRSIVSDLSLSCSQVSPLQLLT